MIFDSVATLPHVGEKRLAALHQLGIETIYQLLTHFPFRYEDRQSRPLASVLDQEKVTVTGTVVGEPTIHYFGRNKSKLFLRLMVDNEVIGVSFFNQPYLKKQLKQGTQWALYGKWEAAKQQLLGIKVLGATAEQKWGAVYRVNQHIRQKTVVQLIETALEQYQDQIPEIVPQVLRDAYQMMSHSEAIRQLHFPDTSESMQRARWQMSYQELFLYQYRLQKRKQKQYLNKQPPLNYDVAQLKRFIQQLPFELTDDQKTATNELCRDLRAPHATNRLLQGDVGSGKTVVAAIALVAAMLSGYQGALMVPTELLAQQHFDTLQRLFHSSSMKLQIALLTSTTSSKERQQLLHDLAADSLHILIGTHALLEPDVVFDKLGFVIIDEQHRFGVQQRAQLIAKQAVSHVLYLTATPIPRTLAITTMGDMDVSIIKERPAGRLPVKTVWRKASQLPKVWDFVATQMQQNHQVYVVAALIDESESLAAQNAQAVYEQLSERFRGCATVGLLHGRLKNDEKEAVMAEFVAGRTQLLVATTVIEVGVDVPNATVMVIQDADRFGLAQLHQLRGRIGRGTAQSYCILIGTPKTEYGKERLRIMTESNDGFYLSQQDLLLRGAGDVLGLKQAGIPDFQCADVIRDSAILELAHKDVKQLMGTLEEHEAQRLNYFIAHTRQKGVAVNKQQEGEET